VTKREHIAAELKIWFDGTTITRSTPIERHPKTWRIAFQDFKNIQWIGGKSAESVWGKCIKLKLLGMVWLS